MRFVTISLVIMIWDAFSKVYRMSRGISNVTAQPYLAAQTSRGPPLDMTGIIISCKQDHPNGQLHNSWCDVLGYQTLDIKAFMLYYIHYVELWIHVTAIFASTVETIFQPQKHISYSRKACNCEINSNFLIPYPTRNRFISCIGLPLVSFLHHSQHWCWGSLIRLCC